ncbi:MAG: AraC family transcriptional regulator [Defluviitaleaceae bacterium]|nr:AraC family transcriptional regulator [Defluviitaleaceae bacterium]
MEAEKRMVCFDNDLKIEAYHFEGIMQKFPNHFHEYYVLGFVESGRRLLACKNKEYTIGSGDFVIFNPLDNHACEQVDDRALDWRCLNIEKDAMRRTATEITGRDELPVFTSTVICQSDVVHILKDLHEMIMKKTKDFSKEENFYFLIEQLIVEYTNPSAETLSRASGEIQAACDYMEINYTETITLADLSKVCGLNKYTFLRSFAMQMGITPYRYLSAVRVNKAKNLLQEGVTPKEAAMQSGFADQSHFTRFFKNFIGLTPKFYQDIFSVEGK